MKKQTIITLIAILIASFIVSCNHPAKVEAMKTTKQDSLDHVVLQIAIEKKLLSRTATTEDLTDQVRTKIILLYVLRDAIENHFLPKGSDLKVLTIEVVNEMASAGKLKNYDVFGDVLPEEFIKGDGPGHPEDPHSVNL